MRYKQRESLDIEPCVDIGGSHSDGVLVLGVNLYYSGSWLHIPVCPRIDCFSCFLTQNIKLLRIL